MVYKSGLLIGLLNFIIFLPLQVALCQTDPAVEWDRLYIRIRDGQISKREAQAQLSQLEELLKGPLNTNGEEADTDRLVFPVEGYGPKHIGGKKGSGYQSKGYDFFDGNRHRGHPSHDIFIRDKDRDGLDDSTKKPVHVLSASSGLVVSSFENWQPSSSIRGGNYILIYEPRRKRYYYYAHLEKVFARIGQRLSRRERIGTVGRTGTNAYPARSPTHLHFTVYHSINGNPIPVNPYFELTHALGAPKAQ